MKKEYVLLGILILCVSLFALSNTIVGKQGSMVLLQEESTLVSGHVSENTTWILEDSPYIVVGDVIVNRGVFLTIKPGVVVKFTAGTNLTVKGGLVAQGNATHKITFTSNATSPVPGDWVGILIPTRAHCNITNSIIEYASTGIVVDTWDYSRDLSITHSRVTSNDVGITVCGQRYDLSRPYVLMEGLTIENNTLYGIEIQHGKIQLENSLVAKNKFGIYVPPQVVGGDPGYIKISNSTVSNNTRHGINGFLVIDKVLDSYIVGNGCWGIYDCHLWNCRDTMISNNSEGGWHYSPGDFFPDNAIYNSNITDNNGPGIDCKRINYSDWNNPASLTISGSIIANNSGYGVVTGGGGGVDSDINHNTIIDNGNVGVSANGGRISFNNLYNNSGLYEVENTGGKNIDATYNWWGTTNETLIGERIYDYFDNSSLGVVSYVPFLNSSTHTLYSLTVDPTFYDITGTHLFQPSSWSIMFPNGTIRTVSSPVTYNQAQIGEYSIVNIIWKGVEVVPDITPTILLTADTLWSPSISCRLPTSLTISLSISTSYVGFKVEIDGNLACNEVGLSGAPVLLSYSVTKGESWNDITFVNTASDGGYSAVWMPSATGNYLVRAIWAGNSTYPGATTTINFVATPFEEQNVFSVTSNSTVSELAFNSTSKELSFTVTGPSGTIGYVNVHIAKTLVGNIEDVKVYLDDNQQNYTAMALDDSWLIQFTYQHSTHSVTISLGSIPGSIEIPIGILVMMFLVPIMASAIIILYVWKKKQSYMHASKPKKESNNMRRRRK